MVSRFADSTRTAALVATLAHSSSVVGRCSSIPFADTVVETEFQMAAADGETTPLMICFTDATGATGGAASAAAAGPAARVVRPAAMTKPTPLTNSRTLTTNNQ